MKTFSNDALRPNLREIPASQFMAEENGRASPGQL